MPSKRNEYHFNKDALITLSELLLFPQFSLNVTEKENSQQRK